MPLRDALPLGAAAPWSATVPQQALELITTWDMDERDALAAPPNPDLAWAEVGTHTALGSGIVKIPHAVPSSLDFERFRPGDTRNLKTIDAVVTRVQAGPLDLSFGIPMRWNTIGNGYELMSKTNEGGQDTLIAFVGISGIGGWYVKAGKAYKCQLLGDLFQSGMYCTGSGISMTTPTKLAYGGDAQGAATGGVALFSDGTGAANSVGDQHYSNPRQTGSARFKNVYSGFGEFMANYGRSLVLMTQTPDATLANKYSGAHVTDTIGPSYMRDKMWRMLVSSLTMQTADVSGNGVAAATTNPYAMLQALGITEENFLGQVIHTAFGPKRFWIASELDRHPYVLANPNTNGSGVPGDFWVNICSAPGRATWAKLACNSKLFVPVFRFYGPGDPLAEHTLMMRFEGNLDAGSAGGAPGEAQVFFQV